MTPAPFLNLIGMGDWALKHFPQAGWLAEERLTVLPLLATIRGPQITDHHQPTQWMIFDQQVYQSDTVFLAGQETGPLAAGDK